MSGNLVYVSTEEPGSSNRSEIGSVLSPDPFTIEPERPVGAGISPSMSGARGTEATASFQAVPSSVVSIDHFNESSERRRIFRLDQVHRPAPMFRTVAAWQCEVLQVGNRSFVARLHPYDASEIEEESTFEFSEVEPSERRFIKPGARFYWHVGDYTTEKKQVIKGSILVFTRVPAWTKRRELAASEAAEETAKLLGWDNAGEETGTG